MKYYNLLDLDNQSEGILLTDLDLHTLSNEWSYFSYEIEWIINKSTIMHFVDLMKIAYPKNHFNVLFLPEPVYALDEYDSEIAKLSELK